MSSIVKSARADAIEYLKNENNVNFSRNSLQGVGREVRIVPVGPPSNGFGFGNNF
jgi:hypothetical protein